MSGYPADSRKRPYDAYRDRGTDRDYSRDRGRRGGGGEREDNPWFRDPNDAAATERDDGGRYDDRSDRRGNGDRRDRDYRSHGGRGRGGYGRGYDDRSYHTGARHPDAAIEDGEILNYSERPRSPPRGPRSDRHRHDHRSSRDHSAFRRDRSSDRSQGALTASAPDAGPLQSAPAEEENVMEVEEEPKPQLSAEEILAAARAKRAAILAKHASAEASRAATPAAEGPAGLASVAASESGSATNVLNSPAARVALRNVTPQVEGDDKNASIPGSPAPMPEEATLDLTQDAPSHAADHSHPLDDTSTAGGQAGHQSISAADYNPDDDRRLDDRRQLEKGRKGQDVGPTAKAQMEKPGGAVVRPLEEVEDDEDDDDMFAIGTKKAKKPRLEAAEKVDQSFVPVIDRGTAASAAVADDNFDDADGYYRFILGELLDGGRYHVHANLGRGMFASVVRARDTTSKDGHEVAIKVVRSQESMYKAGQKEAGILRKLQDADPAAKYHLIRLERTFEHRGHLCLVFESMSMNLREVVKRFGKDVGINLRAVRAYAHQILLGLSLMKKCNVMHADLKPDNILVNETKSVLKICDLGSASDVTENEITPYLVSRFYRAPEIILGLPYDTSIDVWSIGCTLYELYTGKILFPGRSNNHLLLLIMELKGKFNSKTLKKARFADVHFDENGSFLSVEKNKATGADVVKPINIPPQPAQGLPARLKPLSVVRKMQPNDVNLLTAFVDLLDKMLALEPGKRITPKEALNHPFIRGT